MSFINLLVAFMQISYYLTLFTFIPLTMILRLAIVFKNGALTKGRKALIALDFTAFSFFYYLKEKTTLKTLYLIILLIYFVLAFFAFGFGVHMYF